MKINIDPKISKRSNRPLKTISEKNQISHCVNDISRHIREDRDCLLVTSPASLKTQILLAIANLNPDFQKIRLVLPVYRPYMFQSDSLSHICMQSFDTYLKDKNKICEALFVDEGELIDDPIKGESLEQLLIESDPGTPLVLAINARQNIDKVAKWLSDIRKRKCMLIRTQYPKSIIPTYFTVNGEWLTLIDKKKLNRKVKTHLKTIKKPISLKKIYYRCNELLTSQDLLPAIFVLPQMNKAIELWKKHPEKESSPGQYMTNPQVVRILDEYPELKDNPFVFEMLKKRAGICFNDHIWLQLIENFFYLGALDVIFLSSETIPHLYCSGKSIILMGHPMHDTKNPDDSLALWNEQLIMRTGCKVRILDEINNQTVYCILTDSPDVSPVHIKDYFDPGGLSLQSHFNWTIHNMLGRNYRKRSALDDLNKSFLVASQGARNSVLFHDAIMEIQAELPQAKCLPVNAMSFLTSIRIKWTKEQSEYQKQAKLTKKRSLETKFHKIQFLLDCLPCNDCHHETTCHHRGSKRLRELLDTFYANLRDQANGHILLEATIPCFDDLLQQLEWIDSRKNITPKGELAYRTSSIESPLFVECFYNNLIPMDNHRLGASILAGFLLEKWSFPSHVDLRYSAISNIYQEMLPHLKETTQKLLSLGISPRIPDYQMSCLYYSLTSLDDKILATENSNLNQTIVDFIINRVNRYFSKIDKSMT
jgi:hypothetical protein